MTSTPRFRRRRTRLLAVVTVAVLVALAIGVAAANRFAGPLPPRRLVMSTGREDGAYYDFGKQYRRVLAGHGFTLDLVPGAGSIETLTRLMAGTADVGFVQGGTAHAVDTSGLTALGGVFDEPVWVFHRRAVRVTDLSDLKGRRVAVGEPASGTRLLALQLLNDTGVTAANSTLRELPSDAVEAALLGDAVDAAFVVASPRAPLVHRLLAAPDLTLMSERRHLAYRTRHAFLTSVPIGEGVIDMARNIPPEDKVLLAARASLVVRDGIHPDLVRLLLFRGRSGAPDDERDGAGGSVPVGVVRGSAAQRSGRALPAHGAVVAGAHVPLLGGGAARSARADRVAGGRSSAGSCPCSSASGVCVSPAGTARCARPSIDAPTPTRPCSRRRSRECGTSAVTSPSCATRPCCTSASSITCGCTRPRARTPRAAPRRPRRGDRVGAPRDRQTSLRHWSSPRATLIRVAPACVPL